MTDPTQPDLRADPIETRNENFKRRSAEAIWAGLILAVALHVVIFVVSPNIEAEDVSFEADEIEVLDVPDQIEIPPPPQAILRPAVPVVSATVSAEITITETTLEANPPEDLPPPPVMAVESNPGDRGGFSVFEVNPVVQNVPEITRALEREWPRFLKDAGLGGTAVVHFEIDEEGKVIRAYIHESTGFEALDEAALRVANIYEFSPALNRDKPVKVRVAIPVSFKVN